MSPSVNPPCLHNVIACLVCSYLELMDQELTSAKATLEAKLTEQQKEAADLATENEHQAGRDRLQDRSADARIRLLPQNPLRQG